MMHLWQRRSRRKTEMAGCTVLDGAGLCALFFGSYATDVSIEKREDFERLLWY